MRIPASPAATRGQPPWTSPHAVNQRSVRGLANPHSDSSLREATQQGGYAQVGHLVHFLPKWHAQKRQKWQRDRAERHEAEYSEGAAEKILLERWDRLFGDGSVDRWMQLITRRWKYFQKFVKKIVTQFSGLWAFSNLFPAAKRTTGLFPVSHHPGKVRRGLITQNDHSTPEGRIPSNYFCFISAPRRRRVRKGVIPRAATADRESFVSTCMQSAPLDVARVEIEGRVH